MKKTITITRQDGEQKSVSAVIGEAFIGRALVTNCKDQRISRRHGLIAVSSEGNVILTSKERMYYIPFGQAKRQLLHRGTTVVLSDGDRFSFLPQRFCFLIKISDVLKNEERKRKNKDLLEGRSILKGQCDQDDIIPEEPKRMKIPDTIKPQPSTSRSDDVDKQCKVEQKRQDFSEMEDNNASIREQNESSVQEKSNENVVHENSGTKKSLSSASVGEEDGEEQQSAEEKPSNVEEENDFSDTKQERRGYDDEVADFVYPETGVSGNRHKTNTAEENEGKGHQNEENQLKSSNQFVFGPSSNLIPLEEFWSRSILSGPINSGEPKIDKPRYPEENIFQEDDYRPLCPHGKSCFNLTPKHRQDFRHDMPEPQVKSNNSFSK